MTKVKPLVASLIEQAHEYEEKIRVLKMMLVHEQADKRACISALRATQISLVISQTELKRFINDSAIKHEVQENSAELEISRLKRQLSNVLQAHADTCVELSGLISQRKNEAMHLDDDRNNSNLSLSARLIELQQLLQQESSPSNASGRGLRHEIRTILLEMQATEDQNHSMLELLLLELEQHKSESPQREEEKAQKIAAQVVSQIRQMRSRFAPNLAYRKASSSPIEYDLSNIESKKTERGSFNSASTMEVGNPNLEKIPSIASDNSLPSTIAVNQSEEYFSPLEPLSLSTPPEKEELTSIVKAKSEDLGSDTDSLSLTNSAPPAAIVVSSPSRRVNTIGYFSIVGQKRSFLQIFPLSALGPFCVRFIFDDEPQKGNAALLISVNSKDISGMSDSQIKELLETKDKREYIKIDMMIEGNIISAMINGKQVHSPHKKVNGNSA